MDDEVRQDEPDDVAIDIAIPVMPEVNPEVYRDVEPMLFRGFLTMPAEINHVEFVFKSLNHHEFELARLMAGSSEGMTGTRRFYDIFLALGVLMVDGRNVLPVRERYIGKLVQYFSEMPNLSRSRMIRYLSEVNRRASVGTSLVEVFIHENTSRFRWAQVRGLDLSSTSVTGIVGTERLGLNWAQLVWRALNAYEDTRDVAEREWDCAKFTGSCFAGSGIRKVYRQDAERKRKEVEDRTARRDAVLRNVLFGEPMPKGEQRGQGVMTVARTVEDLADQLKRSLKGERDWHDEVVAAAEEAVRQQNKSRIASVTIPEPDPELGDKPIYGATNMAGIPLGEVQRRVAQQLRDADAQQPAWAGVPEVHDPKAAEFATKWGYLQDPPTKKGEG